MHEGLITQRPFYSKLFFQDDHIETPFLFTAIGQSGRVYTPGGSLTFENVKLNIGNAFKGNYFFQPKLSGIYEFSFSCFNLISPGAAGSDRTTIAILKNYIEYSRIQGSSWHDNINLDGSNSGTTIQMALNTGEFVNLKVSSGSVYANPSIPMVFTGKYLRPL